MSRCDRAVGAANFPQYGFLGVMMAGSKILKAAQARVAAEAETRRLLVELEHELGVKGAVAVSHKALAIAKAARAKTKALSPERPGSDEIEALRLANQRDYGELTDDPGPGSFYCHEALYMTGYLVGAIDAELCNHPAIMTNLEWFRLAMEAQDRLAELYQAIGEVHMPASPPAEARSPGAPDA